MYSCEDRGTQEAKMYMYSWLDRGTQEAQELLLAAPQATFTLLSWSPNFPHASPPNDIC